MPLAIASAGATRVYARHESAGSETANIPGRPDLGTGCLRLRPGDDGGQCRSAGARDLRSRVRRAPLPAPGAASRAPGPPAPRPARQFANRTTLPARTVAAHHG